MSVQSRALALQQTVEHSLVARWMLTLIGTAAVVVLPFVINGYLLHVVTLILIYLPLAFGQNLITGNSGQISMGHAAFYGTGAYIAAALSIYYGLPAPLILLVALVAVGFLGLLVGLPAIRVSGDYLFIVTIGINLVFLDIATQWVPVTGGPSGLPGVPIPTLGPIVIRDYVSFYFFALVVAASAMALVLLIVRSRFGLVIQAVRDDPIAAQASGMTLTTTRVAVFVVGAAIAGLSGVLYAYFTGFVGPQDFGIPQSLLIFEMVILGGLGSVPGSIVGTALMVGIPEVFRPLQPFQLGLGGLVILVFMVWRPQGILGRAKVANMIKV